LLGISREDPEAFLLGRYQSNQSLAATLGHKEIGGLTPTLSLTGIHLLTAIRTVAE